MNDLEKVLNDIREERARQDEKWGGAGHDDRHDPETWVQIIQDYAGWARIMSGQGSPDKARRRLMQVAALAVAACESMDRLMQDADSEANLAWKEENRARGPL